MDTTGEPGAIHSDGSIHYDGDLPIGEFLTSEQSALPDVTADNERIVDAFSDLLPKLHAKFDITDAWIEIDEKWEPTELIDFDDESSASEE